MIIKNKFDSFIPLMYNDECEFISNFLNDDDILLEWGSGNSTIYWSGLVKKVITIEHHKKYYDFVEKVKNGYGITNIKQIFIPPNDNLTEYGKFIDYIEYPKNNNIKFTKVLIDGEARNFCAKSIVNIINENTIVFVHDFNNKKYQEILENYSIIKQLSSHENMGIVALKIKKNNE
jgi:hypothetical protein